MEVYKSGILDMKYGLLYTIGEGVSSKVKLAEEISTGKKFAVKIFKKYSYISTELNMLKKIKHPNIIKLIEGSKGLIKKPNFTNKMVYYFVLEFAENGDLFDYVLFANKGFGEKYGRYLFKELINGIDACHLAGVAHRDLKTENIMLSDDWDLKIADFGLATLLSGKDKTGKLNTLVGTTFYIAPEIHSQKPYFGSSADIFSSGVILFLLVTGKLPFAKANKYDSYYRNFMDNNNEGFWSKVGPLILNISIEFKSLINLLLVCDPDKRPTINDIKNHPWYLKECVTKDQMREEFEILKKIVNQQKKIEADEKKNKIKSVKGSTKVNKVYKSSDSNHRDLDFNNELDISLERNIDYYVDKKNNYKIITNISDPMYLLFHIYRYFKEYDERKKAIKVNESKFSLEVCYEFDDETLKQLDYLDVESLKLKINIKKMEEDDLIIEFRKLQGEKRDFYETYDKFSNCKEYFDVNY